MHDSEILDLAVLGQAYTQDPYPLYRELRVSAPVRRVLLYGLPAWLVTRYEDVRDALNDPSLSHDRTNANPYTRAARWLFADEQLELQHHMLRSDPPKHTQIRRLAAQAFLPRRVAALRPRMQQISDELIERLLPVGRAELISDYAFPFPLMVIMEILGVPAKDRDQLHRWSDSCAAASGAGGPSAIDILGQMRDYFVELISRKRQGQDAGGLLDTLAAACDGHGAHQRELLSSAFQLLQGGHVTTLGLIANGMLALLLDPGRLDHLRDQPQLIDGAVEEFLRFDGPMEIATVRFTTQDTRIAGVDIPGGGEAVVLALASANRDPEKFVEPEKLDFERDTTGHLAFGHGAHFCLGASLARAEAQIAFRSLIGRLDDLALAVDRSELAWRQNPHLRRPDRLPVTFKPVHIG